MRKIITGLVFISLFVNPVFSQYKHVFTLDTTLNGLSLSGKGNLFVNSKGRERNNLRIGNGLDSSFSSSLLRGHSKNLSIIGLNFQNYDRMPVIKPEGYFSMRIYKPNTTVKNSLRIINPCSNGQNVPDEESPDR
jgi:hypothetical protein